MTRQLLSEDVLLVNKYFGRIDLDLLALSGATISLPMFATVSIVPRIFFDLNEAYDQANHRVRKFLPTTSTMRGNKNAERQALMPLST